MKRTWFVSSAMALAVAAPLAAHAQTPAAAGAYSLEEVVVTAQRVEENLQRAAIAMSAVGSEDLQRAGVTDVSQLTKLSPSLQIGTLFGGYPTIYMRGVGNTSTNSLSDPAVAFSLDGVPLARQSATQGQFFDLQRLEVLKGPQGTLYGRNATGGAINIIPAKPVLGEYGADVTVEFGNYNTVKGNAAVNIPLGENLAARISAQSVQHDGYFSDGTGDEDGTSLRAQLRAEPSDSVRMNFSADYSKQSGVSGGTVVGLPYDDFIGMTDPRAQPIITRSFSGLSGATLSPITNNFFNDSKYYGAHMQADIDTPLGTVTVLPSYRRNDLRFRLPSSFVIDQDEKDTQKTLEVRLASDDSRPLRYILGAFYFDEQTDFNVFYNQNFFGALLDVKTETQSFALFGRLTWAVTDRLRLTGGIRSTRDEKSANLRSLNAIVICPSGLVSPPRFCPGTPPVANNGLSPPPQYFTPGGALIPIQPWGTSGAIINVSRNDLAPSKDFEKVTYRGGVEFDLRPDSLLYATIETGFKAGGFFVSIDNPAYNPETITAYTIGSKNRLFDNRLQLNAELFYWKYKDQQVAHFKTNSIGGNEFVTENIGESTMAGVDLDVQFLATENTLLMANLQYLDAEYSDFRYNNPAGSGVPVTGCPFTGPTAGFFTVNCSGLRPIKSPEWTATLGIQQTVPLSSGAKVVFDAHTNYQSEIMTGAEYLREQYQDAYWLTDLQVTYTDAEDRYSVSGYVNNVTDEAVAGQISVHPRSSQLFIANLRAPRTYGLRLSASF